MEASSTLILSKVTPFGFLVTQSNIISFRHFNKRLEAQSSLRKSCNGRNLRTIETPLKLSLSPSSSDNARSFSTNAFPSQSISLLCCRAQSLQPVSCSMSNTAGSDYENPVLKNPNNLSVDSVKAALSQLTPLDICKWSLVFSIAIAATKWTVNLLFNPFFWMYFSLTWLFWPWFVAIGLAFYGLCCLGKHLRGEAKTFEQLAVVTSAFTWLTLVPPAHFNGFLEGWPFVFFFVYHYFFFFNVSVRKRLYGDYYPREHDPKWDIELPIWQRLLFCVGVMVGHWLAAFEGPELHRIPGGWNNVGVWALIMMTLFMHYHSTWYLAKYSEKVVVPTAVVQFGPYRFVRHPIYASTMLLFVTYFIALRAPLSSLFVVAVCLIYYGLKAKLEEALMVETFGDGYIEYANKVIYRLIPFVY